jgi:hypothetical protein
MCKFALTAAQVFPCGQCTRSSLQCIPSTRKPRTRHAGKRAVDSELRNRITKLESLVESLSGEVGVENGQGNVEKGGTPEEDGDEAPSPTVGQYLGSPFWSSLTTEVQAIRDALEDEPGEQDHDTSTPETNTTTHAANGTQVNPNDFDFFVCPPGAIYVMPGALVEPAQQVQPELIDAFMDNVGPMFKLFHTPSLRRFLEHGQPYLGHDANSPGLKALRAAIWYAAVNTLSDDECQVTLGQGRRELMQQYRRATDVLLAQADLANTTDLATVQALLISLVSCIHLTILEPHSWYHASQAVQPRLWLCLHIAHILVLLEM